MACFPSTEARFSTAWLSAATRQRRSDRGKRNGSPRHAKSEEVITLKYDLSAFTPIERQLLRNRLEEESIVFTLDQEILRIDDADEGRVDAALVMVERIGTAISEEIEMEEQALAGGSKAGRCDNCGSTPAAPINLRREVGLVLASSTHNVSAVLCQPCAEALTNEMQRQTALKGWTSPVSLFLNPFVIAGNERSRRKHRRNLEGEI